MWVCRRVECPIAFTSPTAGLNTQCNGVDCPHPWDASQSILARNVIPKANYGDPPRRVLIWQKFWSANLAKMPPRTQSFCFWRREKA